MVFGYPDQSLIISVTIKLWVYYPSRHPNLVERRVMIHDLFLTFHHSVKLQNFLYILLLQTRSILDSYQGEVFVRSDPEVILRGVENPKWPNFANNILRSSALIHKNIKQTFHDERFTSCAWHWGQLNTLKAPTSNFFLIILTHLLFPCPPCRSSSTFHFMQYHG